MQSLKTTTTLALIGLATTCGGAAMGRVSMSFPTAPVANVSIAKSTAAAAAMAAIKPALPAAKIAAAPALKAMGKSFAVDESLRARMRFETVRWNGKPIQTLDEASRVLLAKAAAEQMRLHEVGLGFQDVYGIIEAETSWIAREGASKNGTPNLGLAQFEPRTAHGLGITDPSDPLQAVFGAALYMKTGAQWASSKLAGLKLSPAERAEKVREGVSVHYNLSVKGRNKWDGRNTAQLPIETQRHIRNARAGAAEAAELARLIKI